MVGKLSYCECLHRASPQESTKVINQCLSICIAPRSPHNAAISSLPPLPFQQFTSTLHILLTAGWTAAVSSWFLLSFVCVPLQCASVYLRESHASRQQARGDDEGQTGKALRKAAILGLRLRWFLARSRRAAGVERSYFLA